MNTETFTTAFKRNTSNIVWYEKHIEKMETKIEKYRSHIDNHKKNQSSLLENFSETIQGNDDVK